MLWLFFTIMEGGSDLKYPEPYIDFLYHFHIERDYFECHEVLEEYWKKTGMERDSIWVCLIQVAVCFYHYRRENLRGAAKLLDKVLSKLPNKKEEIIALGIHFDLLLLQLKICKDKIHNRIPYESISIPIIDHELCSLYKQKRK